MSNRPPTKTTPERELAILSARDLRRQERKTARALLLSEARALANYRKPVRYATNAVVAAHAVGQDPIAQVRRQAPALQSTLRQEIARSHLDARAAGRRRLEDELDLHLHSAEATLVQDDAFAEVVASSLATAWGAAGLALLAGNALDVTARELAELAKVVDGRLRRAAATEVARSFNSEREELFGIAVGRSGQTGPQFGTELPAPGAFKIWSAVLDGKTCPRCFVVDGETIELHRTFSAGVPPLHPHCRCIVEHIIVKKPQRLEDIAIDYDLFKQELRDVIREGRLEASERQALPFASDSLGPKRSPLALSKRFAEGRYEASGSAGAPPVPPAPPRRPPPPGGSGSGGSGGRKPLTFQFGFTKQDVEQLGARSVGRVGQVSRQLFGRECPTPESWLRLFETPPGYRLQFEEFVAHAKEFTVLGRLHTAAGEDIGVLKRSFSKGRNGLTVSHDHFEIENPEHRKKGIAKSINRAALQGYREMGVQEITITAGLKDGPVAWATQGFSWPPGDPFYEKKFREFLIARGQDAKLAQEVAELALNGAFRVVEYSWNGARLGEEFLKSLGSWTGGMRLDDSDPRYSYAKRKFGL